MRLKSIVAVAIMAGVTAAALPASAEVMKFKAALSAASEVPPHPDLKGAGTVTASLDTATRMLTYTAEYSGLTGPAVAAHFHGAAETGKNAGVMVPVAGELTSPIEGTATLNDDQVKALEGGMMYFNVHTAANKGGEIRGQMIKGM